MKILILLLIYGACAVKLDKGLGYDCTYCQPEQVHINFGEKTNDIVVTWSTFDNPKESRVQYGIGQMNLEASGNVTRFQDGGTEKRVQYIHRVTLKDLKFDTRYVYHVGSQYGWSEKFSFKTPPEGEDWVVRAAIYGDMGNTNAHSLSYLQDEAERDHWDLILHVGDFAYDMDSDQARVGDQFMRQIQPLAAIVPYMVCPGNHENAYNFSNYRNRFSMPGSTESLYYSFDIGPVHFISISTEFYYYLHYGAKLLINQFEWLKNDLTEANLPENRSKRPWIILYGHRPMYCSNSDDEDCSLEFTRKGVPFLGFSLEPLLKDFGVDLVIWAHEHSYERTWPMYDYKVYNGSAEQPYLNAKAPVHIITGSAGCKEGNDKFSNSTPEWSAFHTRDYGYTRFIAHNKSHIYMEQVSVNLKGKVVDSFWMVKNQHGPYTNLPMHSTAQYNCSDHHH